MKALVRVSSALVLLALLLGSSSMSFAKENKSSRIEINPAISQYADQLPQPVGGYESFIEKVKYPAVALNAKLQGDVLAKITLDANGNVSDVELTKTLGGGCDEAVINAIKETKFEYNSANSNAGNTQISVLFKFALTNN